MGAAVNEAVQKALAEKFKDNPAMHQWASAVLGAAAAKVVGGNAQTGASTAASGTKNNALDPAHILQTIKENPVLSAALLFAGYVVDQQNRIVNKSGEVIASWSESAGGWVDSAGDFVGNTVDSIVLWAKGDSSRSKPKEYGTPNSTEVVRGADGKVEKYTVYGPNGKIEKEVRLTGKDHGDIPRPNVKEPNYNVNPETGEVYQNGYRVRPARADEIPAE